MPDFSYIYSQRNEIIAIGKYGVLWQKNTHIRLGVYDEETNGQIYDTNYAPVGYFINGEVKNNNGVVIGKISSGKLFVDDSQIG